MIYSVIADSAKYHLTDNYVLAQVVQRDLQQAGYRDVNIMNIDNTDIVSFYMRETNPVTWLEFSLSFPFKLPIEDFISFQHHLPSWDKRQKKQGRSYFKLYGMTHVICLTHKQRDQLTWEMINHREDSLVGAYIDGN